MKKFSWSCLILVSLLLLSNNAAFAQTYLFSLDVLDTHVYMNSDGNTSIEYYFTFTNNPSASPIDYVDVGMPSGKFSLDGAIAEVDGNRVSLSRSDYQGSGTGFAIVMGSSAILPGQTGNVHVIVPNAGGWLRYDDQDKSYASFVFSPLWFGRQYLENTTNMSVTFHFPLDVKPEEPRWHAAPPGWQAEPETGFDEQGRIIYTWRNPQGEAYQQNNFGASFPAQYIPESAITKPSIFEVLGISEDTCFTIFCCGGIVALILGTSWASTQASRRRKLQYLPPKIAIEGLGIKRGLTAVEAAILMEQPLDKVMTMILFGLLKKNAATVTKKDPLTIEAADPIPEGLNPYEIEFLDAFKKPAGKEQKLALQSMTVNLVKSLSNKMKGFGRKETIDYYRSIMDRAWKEVESAQTPEIKSEMFDKYMEWTMLDKDYDDHTRDVFRTGPVFIPNWWGRFDPVYRGPVSAPKPLAAPPAIGGAPSGGGQISLPTLPGGSFAASIVNGVENFAGGVIGNVSDFTSSITNKTNPVPVATRSGSSSSGSSRGGGGGCACACACACAGCACACAGGGR